VTLGHDKLEGDDDMSWFTLDSDEPRSSPSSSCVNGVDGSARGVLGFASEPLEVMCTLSPVLALSFLITFSGPPIHCYHLINAPLQQVLDIPAKMVIVGSAGYEGMVGDEENEDSKCREA
jgi:hypothetical protein